MSVDRTRGLVRLVIAETAWYLWAYAAAGFVLYAQYREVSKLMLLVLTSVVYAAFALVRHRVNNAILFTALHIFFLAAAAVPAVLFSPAGWMVDITAEIRLNMFAVCFAALAAAAALRSVLIRVRSSYEPDSLKNDLSGWNPEPTRGAQSQTPEYDSGTMFFYVASLAALSIFSEYIGTSVMTAILATTAAALLLFRMAYWQMRSIDESMELVGKSSPVGLILSFSGRLSLSFCLVLFVAGVAAYMFGMGGGLQRLLLSLWDGFIRLLRFLLSRRREREAELAPLAAGPPVSQLPFDDSIGADRAAPWMIWVVLEQAVYYLMVLASSIAVIYGAYRLFKLLSRRAEPQTDDVSESVLPDIFEFVRPSFFTRGNEPTNPVRRMFYRKVNRHIARKAVSGRVLPTDTAAEIAEKIKASEDIDALAENYQRIRYGKTD